MAVTIENALEPLAVDDVARPTSGGLVRVAPHREPLPPLVDLEGAVHNLDWATDVDAHGLPAARSSEGKLFGIPTDYNFLLTTDPAMSIPRVHRQIATLLHADVNEVYLVWPKEDDIDAIEYKGQPAMGAVAAFLLDDRPTHDKGHLH